ATRKDPTLQPPEASAGQSLTQQHPATTAARAPGPPVGTSGRGSYNPGLESSHAEVSRSMATSTEVPPSHKKKETIEQAVIRFCGDSGDGMQITGSQFTNTAALFGNDLATFPDFPAEIRAPAGTLPGVSGFQLNFASSDVFTPGDAVDALVAMNPAALR